jgi:hypothetical protein
MEYSPVSARRVSGKITLYVREEAILVVSTLLASLHTGGKLLQK